MEACKSSMDSHLLEKKEKALEAYLSGLDRAAVAFSAGVDSAFLLKKAQGILRDRLLAVTVHSCFQPEREIAEAIEFCRKEKIRHLVLEADVLGVEGIAENPKNRCYLCKKALFGMIKAAAAGEGICHVLEGSNLDDTRDFRPGLQAVEELGVSSPLKEAGLTKEDIRLLSKELGLYTWKKPSFACLASRFVYGEELTGEKLKMVEEAERLLASMGLEQFRVRIHGADLARIEILPEDFSRLMDKRLSLVGGFQRIGFAYISLDLQGYRTGSMNHFMGLEKNNQNAP